MKKFLLKTMNFILNVIMVASCLYAIFNLVMTFLPADIQETVYNFLNMSSEYIATFSISATINAVVLIAAKIAQTYTKVKLELELSKAEKVIDNAVSVNEAVIERTNAVINNLNLLQEMNNALLSVQKVTTERNIKASDKLVYTEEKEEYKKALEEIEKAKADLEMVNNISTVYEKTEIKEVIVEKQAEDELEGRV